MGSLVFLLEDDAFPLKDGVSEERLTQCHRGLGLGTEEHQEGRYI